jgi:hypothetical protein
LDRLLARLHASKAELLMVLGGKSAAYQWFRDDIRCQVTRRKVSAGTRSDLGQDCRDAFLGSPNLRQARWRSGISRQPAQVPGHTVIHPWRNSLSRAASLNPGGPGFAGITGWTVTH